MVYLPSTESSTFTVPVSFYINRVETGNICCFLNDPGPVSEAIPNII